MAQQKDVYLLQATPDIDELCAQLNMILARISQRLDQIQAGFGSANSTGLGSAALGSNCPASTVSKPYTWIKALSADGVTVVYIPAWK
jgi:hypothetical protein